MNRPPSGLSTSLTHCYKVMRSVEWSVTPPAWIRSLFNYHGWQYHRAHTRTHILYVIIHLFVLSWMDNHMHIGSVSQMSRLLFLTHTKLDNKETCSHKYHTRKGVLMRNITGWLPLTTKMTYITVPKASWTLLHYSDRFQSCAPRWLGLGTKATWLGLGKHHHMSWNNPITLQLQIMLRMYYCSVLNLCYIMLSHMPLP